jgi:hypothetical protein
VNQMFSKTLILTGLCWALSPAYAGNLLPGGTVTPVPGYVYGSPQFPSGAPNGGSSSGANPLLQEGFSYSPANSKGAVANITFENTVYVDPVTGDLDFFYQIQNTYTGAATNQNTIAPTVQFNESFEGVTITGVSEITSTNYQTFDDFVKPTGGGITSVSLGNYDSQGDADLTVTFSAPIAPKQDSAILVIQTNATDFDQAGEGTFAWKANPPAGSHSGNTLVTNPFTLDALEPLPTPEPGFYGVLSLGIAGLLLLAHRRSGKAKAKAADAV